jgi:ArsR family transcriptional regulator, virulence genes transcriptional regulator
MQYIYIFVKHNEINIFNKMHFKELSTGQLEQAAIMLKAIAHPVRISIINYLEDGKKLTVTEIMDLLELEQSTTSHHLGILKDKGVLVSKREGKNTLYFLRNVNLANIVECICNCQKL